MSVVAVASPDAPLVSRVLAGRTLGSARGSAVLVAILAGLVVLALLRVATLPGVPAVVTGALAVVVLTLLPTSFGLGRLWSPLLGRLPRVVVVRREDPYSGALVGVLATLRDLATEDADTLAVRLLNAPSHLLGNGDATTARLVLELASGEGPLASGEEEELLADALAVAARAPLDTAWCPVTSHLTVVDDLRERRDALARTVAALRDGVPAEWALRRLAADPGAAS